MEVKSGCSDRLRASVVEPMRSIARIEGSHLQYELYDSDSNNESLLTFHLA